MFYSIKCSDLTISPKKNYILLMLTNDFFNRDSLIVAKDLLGKMICHKFNGLWLSVQIIETEAYYIDEKGSHSIMDP